MLNRGDVRRREAAGFTTVELMVTLLVVAILAAMAVPTMRSVVVNNRIRAVSQSVQNGLALARAEAVRLNTQVEFVLQPNGWVVRDVRAPPGTVLQRASGNEGGNGLTLTVAPAGADRVTFNSFGQTPTVNPSNGSLAITQLDIESPNPPSSGRYRPLRVELFAGGMSRACDPAAEATEARACRRS